MVDAFIAAGYYLFLFMLGAAEYVWTCHAARGAGECLEF